MGCDPVTGAHHVIVGMGSNLGDSCATLVEAVNRLGQRAEGEVVRSSLYRSEPVDCPPGSPEFLNAVVAFLPRRVETPESLLDYLQAVENELGRSPRKARNEARAVDLDLLMFGGEVRSSARLSLPHPRMVFRRFVLGPLAEIAPDLVVPGQRERVSVLLGRLPEVPRVERIDYSHWQSDAT